MGGALSDLATNTLLVVEQGRTNLTRMIAINGLLLILTSIFIGTLILAFFGISLPVVGGRRTDRDFGPAGRCFANQTETGTKKMVNESVNDRYNRA